MSGWKVRSNSLLTQKEIKWRNAAFTTALAPTRTNWQPRETDAVMISLAKTDCWVRSSGNKWEGKGVVIGTEVCFSPALNGPLALEVRVELAVALTTRSIFIGINDLNADDVAEPVIPSTVTHTLVTNDLIGFGFDSQLTD